MQVVLALVSALLAAVCGAAIGLLFSAAHRATFDLAGVEVPYVLVLGLLAAAAFLGAMRLLWESRWPSVGGAVGLIAAVGALAIGGPGGSVVIVNDPLGWVWLIAVPVVAIVAVAWPRRRPRTAGPQHADDTMDGPDEPPAEDPSTALGGRSLETAAEERP